MRLFVAIELPDEIRKNMTRAQEVLRPLIPARWTRPDQLHVTLKFLGETPDDLLPELIDNLNAVPIPQGIALQPNGIICFPPNGPIRIVAAELSDESDRCAKLATEIDRACHTAGFRLEGRRWRPHVTLARVKERTPPDTRRLADDAVGAMLVAEPLAVDQFILFESRLSREGSNYAIVAKFPAEY